MKLQFEIDSENFVENNSKLSEKMRDYNIAQVGTYGKRQGLFFGYYDANPFKVFGEAWKEAPLEVVNKGDTVIGNDVWLGNSATIMPGVKIGSGAIIGANSLITKDVEAYTVVGGNPGKVIRKRFDDNTTAFLLRLSWWDWSIEKITDNIQLIAAGNIEALKKIIQ